MEQIFDPLSEDLSDDETTDTSNHLDSRSDISAGQTVDDKTLETNSKKYTDRVSELEKRRLQLSDKFSGYAGKSNRARNKKQTADKLSGTEERGNVTASESPKSNLPNQKLCSSEECADTQKSTDNKGWLELKPFLTVNDHLVNHCGDGKAKTGLEKRIEEAISKKDIQTAVTLSDKLAERDFGKKIVAAIDAKVYTKKRKLEEEQNAAHHKNKLPWGFEHKQRWETKGNM